MAKLPLDVDDFQKDLSLISGIAAIPRILDVVCRVTGMGFAAVARVTEDRWIACSVRDDIGFGLKAGGELEVGTTICNEIRCHRSLVAIDHVAESGVYRDHHTPLKYGFQSYISVPIVLSDGRFFGTLCAIDPKPATVESEQIVNMFALFAELTAIHIESAERLAMSESDLRAERVHAELREQFIAVLGHDLRNPLGALSTGTEILKMCALDVRAERVVAMMEQSVRRMSGLIEDVMDFARGRLGGGISLEGRSLAPVEALLVQVVEELQLSHPGRRVERRLALDEPVLHDRKRLAQLFTNLLGNAFAHGKEGTPVRVEAESRDGMFEFSVANSADPIPPEILARMFHPFARGQVSPSQEGLGLGLYIAAEIAKSHGGSIRVQSNEVETRFTFVMGTRGS